MPTSDALDLPLFQPERGYWIAPIRHHSPACAFAVRAMLRELRPAQVLIEAPADLTPMAEALCDAATQPPVAVVMLDGARAAYAPFCDHSPEYVALHTAREIGAAVRFIDRPAARLFEDPVSEAGPIPLADERPFDDSDYVRGLCARTGCRDGYELWDHLFEARLGQPDWRSLLRDVGIYCTGMRAATAPERITARGDDRRETAMAGHIAHALTTGSVVAVVGGFHAPALIDPKGTAPKTPAMHNAYPVRYSPAAKDALAGHGAGFPPPCFYDAL